MPKEGPARAKKEAQPSNYHQNPISWISGHGRPFWLCPCPVACILSAFIWQINSPKGKPNLRFETISGPDKPLSFPLNSAVLLSFLLQLQLLFAPTEKTRPTRNLPEQQPGRRGSQDSALMGPFERDTSYAAGKRKPGHTICDNSFLRINICSSPPGALSPVAPLFVSLPFSCLPLHFMQINLPEIWQDFAAWEA